MLRNLLAEYPRATTSDRTGLTQTVRIQGSHLDPTNILAIIARQYSELLASFSHDIPNLYVRGTTAMSHVVPTVPTLCASLKCTWTSEGNEPGHLNPSGHIWGMGKPNSH